MGVQRKIIVYLYRHEERERRKRKEKEKKTIKKPTKTRWEKNARQVSIGSGGVYGKERTKQKTNERR